MIMTLSEYKADMKNRQAEPYVSEDGIYVPKHRWLYDGYAAEYELFMTKEIFQEAFKEYIVKEGLLNVQSKRNKNTKNNPSP